MNCFETQARITGFINNQLTPGETEQVLDHVNECDECMEELEVYYTLFTGMKLLDEQKTIDNNLHHGFLSMMHRAEERIIREKMRIIRKVVLFVLILMFVALFG